MVTCCAMVYRGKEEISYGVYRGKEEISYGV